MVKIDLSTLEIRQEQPEDYRTTEAVVRSAFWNQFQPGCVEHYLLHVMRDSKSFVPELNEVAVYHDQIIGQITYLVNQIEGDNGQNYPVLGIGPISVLTEFEGNGIAGRLIEHSLKLAKDKGYSAVLLEGDPDFYSRKGFFPAKDFKVRRQDNVYAAPLQMKKLNSATLDGVTGRYIEDPIYQVDRTEVEKFDATFPKQEKVTGVRLQNKILEMLKMVEDPKI